MNFTRIIYLISLILFSYSSYSQQPVENSSRLISQEDKALTINTISVLPFLDNVDGIYSRPVQTQIINEIKSNHHWGYVESNLLGPVLTPSDYDPFSQKTK